MLECPYKIHIKVFGSDGTTCQQLTLNGSGENEICTRLYFQPYYKLVISFQNLKHSGDQKGKNTGGTERYLESSFTIELKIYSLKMHRPKKHIC